MGVHEGNWCLASFFTYIDERSVGFTLTTEMYLWVFDIFHQFYIFPWQLWHYHFPIGWNSHYLVTKSNPWLNIDNRQSIRKIPMKIPFCLLHLIEGKIPPFLGPFLGQSLTLPYIVLIKLVFSKTFDVLPSVIPGNQPEHLIGL